MFLWAGCYHLLNYRGRPGRKEESAKPAANVALCWGGRESGSLWESYASALHKNSTKDRQAEFEGAIGMLVTTFYCTPTPDTRRILTLAKFNFNSV